MSVNAARTRWGLAAILGLYLLLGAIYSVVNPIFEAPDESEHFFYIKHLADGRGLPVQQAQSQELWKQEGSQPPLYYLLGALLIRPLDTSDAEEFLWRNPLRNTGTPADPGNKNHYVHTEREAFPWQRTVLAVHILRFFSLLLGAGTVYFTWRLTRELFPARPGLALAAAAVVAFTPQFLFISSAVSNDNLITLLSTIALWLMVRMANGERRNWKGGRVEDWGLGVVLGLAALSKLSGLALLGLTALVLGLLAWRRRSWWWLVRTGGRVLLPLVIIAGWWYYRNWVLYGDPTGLRAMLEIVGRRQKLPTNWNELWGEFRGLRWSFWALFGWFNLPVATWIYRVLDALTLLSLGGLFLRTLPAFQRRGKALLREPRIQALGILALWLSLNLVSLVRWTSITPGTQGRLLFPAIAAIAVLLTWGLDSIAYTLTSFFRHLSSHRKAGKPAFQPFNLPTSHLILIFTGAFLLLVSAYAPFGVIAPAYARPQAISEADLPADLPRLERVFDGQMRLIGVQVAQPAVRAGDLLEVTLYWQALAPIAEDYRVSVNLLDAQGQRVGHEDAWPGQGTYPTMLWPPGVVLRDHWHVPVYDDAPAPLVARLAVGVYERGSKRWVPAEPGRDTWVSAGLVKVVPRHWPQAPSTVLAEVGGQIILRGWKLEQWEKLSPSPCLPVSPSPCPPVSLSPGHPLTLTLIWEAQGELNGDYTVFVHLEDEAGQVYATGDGPPRNGNYPTSAWARSEVIEDTHIIPVPEDIPPGEYRLLVGLYDPHTGERLPAFAPDGTRFPADAVPLGEVRIEP